MRTKSGQYILLSSVVIAGKFLIIKIAGIIDGHCISFLGSVCAIALFEDFSYDAHSSFERAPSVSMREREWIGKRVVIGGFQEIYGIIWKIEMEFRKNGMGGKNE